MVGVVRVADLVADAVEHDARVIAVAADHGAQVVLPPFGEMPVVVVGVLALGPAVEGLVHDHEAHAVAEREEAGIDRVVRGADAVHTEASEDGKPALPDVERHRGPHGTAVVVQAHSLDLEILVIEPEAGVGAELGTADAEARGDGIDDLLAAKHLGGELIECGRIDGPELRALNFEFQSAGLAGGFRDGLAIGAGGPQADAGIGGGKLDLDLKLRPVPGNLRRGDEDSVGSDVELVGEDEPGVAVDAGAGIPARGGLGGGVGADGQQVFSGTERIADVAAETGVAVGPAAYFLPIQPDLAVGHHAVEFQPGELGLFFEFDGFAIPRHTGRQPTTGAAAGSVLLELTGDAPVVRDIDLLPAGAVEIDGPGTLGGSLMKIPAGIQWQGFAGGERYG